VRERADFEGGELQAERPGAAATAGGGLGGAAYLESPHELHFLRGGVRKVREGGEWGARGARGIRGPRGQEH
jgi:hypothetical protein